MENQSIKESSSALMRKRSKSLREARTKIAKNLKGIKNCETSKVEGLRF